MMRSLHHFFSCLLLYKTANMQKGELVISDLVLAYFTLLVCLNHGKWFK